MSSAAIPFPGQNIPLVGQSIHVGGWRLVVTALCKCESPQALTLTLTVGQPMVPVRCPSCKRLWGIGQGTKIALEVTQLLTGPPPAEGSA